MWQITLWLTALLEAITILFRFGLDLQATRDTRALSDMTFGLRIHHGYIGIVLILLGYFLCRRYLVVRKWMLAIGIALVASDMIHHFVVLWLVVGDPEFHLTYSALS